MLKHVYQVSLQSAKDYGSNLLHTIYVTLTNKPSWMVTHLYPLKLCLWGYNYVNGKYQYQGSQHSLIGAASWLLSGRKSKNSLICSKPSTSFSKALCATPVSNKITFYWLRATCLKKNFQPYWTVGFFAKGIFVWLSSFALFLLSGFCCYSDPLCQYKQLVLVLCLYAPSSVKR